MKKFINRGDYSDLTIPDVIRMISDPDKYLPNRAKKYGCYYGIVEDNKDPLKLGRLKVRTPLMHDQETLPTKDLPWAQYVAPNGGSKDVGFYFIPEIGAQVIVNHIGGSPWYPVWLGCIYAAPGDPETFVSRYTPPSSVDPEDWDWTDYASITTDYGHKIELEDNVLTRDDGKIAHLPFINIETPRGFFIRIDEDADPSRSYKDESDIKGSISLRTRDNRNIIMNDRAEFIGFLAPDFHYLTIDSKDDFIEIRTQDQNYLRFDDPNEFIDLSTRDGFQLFLNNQGNKADLRGAQDDLYLTLDESASSLPRIGFYNRRNQSSTTAIQLARNPGVGDVVQAYSGGSSGRTLFLEPSRAVLAYSGVGGNPKLEIESDKINLETNNSYIEIGNTSGGYFLEISSAPGRLLIESGPSNLDLEIKGPWTSFYFNHTHILNLSDPNSAMSVNIPSGSSAGTYSIVGSAITRGVTQGT
jgi:hypothetical protein